VQYPPPATTARDVPSRSWNEQTLLVCTYYSLLVSLQHHLFRHVKPGSMMKTNTTSQPLSEPVRDKTRPSQTPSIRRHFEHIKCPFPPFLHFPCARMRHHSPCLPLPRMGRRRWRRPPERSCINFAVIPPIPKQDRALETHNPATTIERKCNRVEMKERADPLTMGDIMPASCAIVRTTEAVPVISHPWKPLSPITATMPLGVFSASW
jgi:hypothetical protein